MPPVKRKIDDLPRIEMTSREAWRAWLANEAAASTGIWLIYRNKSAGPPFLPYEAIVEEALCYGWIDSVHRKVDAQRSMLLMTPRKAKSVWSQLNKSRVEKLIRDGLMTPDGLQKIEAAKVNGSWDALNNSDAGIIPIDLKKALREHPGAGNKFEAFPPGAKKIILQWIYSAKRPETRAARVAATAESAARGERARQA